MQQGTLISLALVNFGLKYATSIVIANALGIERYDVYAVPIASIILLSTFAELGMGKNGLKQLPLYFARGQDAHAAGYFRYSLMFVLVSSFVLGGGTALLETIFVKSGVGPAAVIAALFLPALALVGVLAELVTALGSPVAAALVTRVVVPSVPLAFALYMTHSGREPFSPSLAVGAYGIGWCLGFVCLVFFFLRRAPRSLLRGSGTYLPSKWLREGVGMLGVALCISFMLEGSLVVAELSKMSEGDVSIMAVCLETGGFVYLLSKSLDKAYLPRMTANLERGELTLVEDDVLARKRLVLSVCGLFSVAVLIFGKELLGLFGEGFERGYLALCLVTAGTCAMTFASLAQWAVAFMEGPRRVLLVLGGAVIVLGLGMAYWGSRFGLLGAASTYASVLVIASIILRSRALRLFGKIRKAAG